MPYIVVIFFFLFGLCAGSFLNVLICRLPLGESAAAGRSKCVSCGRTIAKYDLVPVLSYFILRGRCRSCGARISPRYPFVEILTGLLFALLAIFRKDIFSAALFSLFAAALVAVAFIDFRHRIVPNGIVVFMLIIGAALTVFGKDMPRSERIIGLFCASVPLFVLSLIVPGSMGMGDVKLMAAGGLILGWKIVLFSFITGSVIAAAAGLFVAGKSRDGLRASIPFAPFLSAAMIFGLFFGEAATDWYLRLLLR